MRYLLTYRVWSELHPVPLSVNKAFDTLDELRGFARRQGVHYGSVFLCGRDERGVATLRFVGGL